MTQDELERKLYRGPQAAEAEIAESDMREKEFFYVPSMSSRMIVYKGLLLAPQIADFYKELRDPELPSSLVHGAPAIFHQYVSHLAAGASLSATSATTAKSTPCAATSTG